MKERGVPVGAGQLHAALDIVLDLTDFTGCQNLAFIYRATCFDAGKIMP
jgi:hypothetical protein